MHDFMMSHCSSNKQLKQHHWKEHEIRVISTKTRIICSKSFLQTEVWWMFTQNQSMLLPHLKGPWRTHCNFSLTVGKKTGKKNWTTFSFTRKNKKSSDWDHPWLKQELNLPLPLEKRKTRKLSHEFPLIMLSKDRVNHRNQAILNAHSEVVLL